TARPMDAYRRVVRLPDVPASTSTGAPLRRRDELLGRGHGERSPAGVVPRVRGRALRVYGVWAHDGTLVGTALPRPPSQRAALGQVLLHVAEDDQGARRCAGLLQVLGAEHHRAADIGVPGTLRAAGEVLQLAREGELLRVRPGGTDVEVQVGLDVFLLVALVI